METAQETFKQMLRDQVAPALREMGFRGSGQNFSLPSDSHWALLGFQKSQWSSADKITFTVNMTVVARDDWAAIHTEFPQLGERPGANWSPAPIFASVWESGYWHSRIGMVMPGERDEWWDVSAEGESSRVARDVIGAIRDYARPAMRARMT